MFLYRMMSKKEALATGHRPVWITRYKWFCPDLATLKRKISQFASAQVSPDKYAYTMQFTIPDEDIKFFTRLNPHEYMLDRRVEHNVHFLSSRILTDQSAVFRVASRYMAKTFELNIGDPVLFGKFKNKPGKIKGFKEDEGKGKDPIVTVEPDPKGRKEDKDIKLFKIRHDPDRVASCYPKGKTARMTEDFNRLEALVTEFRKYVPRDWMANGHTKAKADALSDSAKKLRDALVFGFENPNSQKLYDAKIGRKIENFRKLLETLSGMSDAAAQVEYLQGWGAGKGAWEKIWEYTEFALGAIRAFDVEVESSLDVGPWQVNLLTAPDGGWDREKIERIQWVLTEAANNLSSSGLGGVVGGRVNAYPSNHVPTSGRGHSSTLASYLISTDLIQLSGEGNPRNLVLNLIHELGHRYYFKVMGSRSRVAWEAFYGDNVQAPDVDAIIRDWEKFAADAAASNTDHWDAKYGRFLAIYYPKLRAKDPQAALWITLVADSIDIKEPQSFAGFKKGIVPGLDQLIANKGKVKVFLHPVTAYSGTSAEELFAEAFSYYIVGGPGRLPEVVRETLKKAVPQIRMGSSVSRISGASRMPVYTAFTYLSRTKDRGYSPECDAVQDIIEKLKQGDSGAAAYAAAALARHPKLRGFRGVIVPAPRSTVGKAPLTAFAKALVKRGVGSRVAVAVIRETPVESSRLRRRQGLPGVTQADHERSMAAVGGIDQDESVLILDDIYTTGSTINAVGATLRKAGHRGTILGAAAGYFEADPAKADCPVSYRKHAGQAVQQRLAYPLRPIDQSKVYYHGTAKIQDAAVVMSQGLIPPIPKSPRSFMSPVGGRVYLTPNLGYALIYALGGDLAGSSPPSFQSNSNKYGYLFTIPGSVLARDLQPDEDSVGEMIYHGGPGWLIYMAETYLTPIQLRKVKEGEVAYWAAAGKKLLKRMTPSQQAQLVDLGAHVAHEGPVKPTEAWRIERARSKELKKDGSNFFQIAERIR